MHFVSEIAHQIKAFITSDIDVFIFKLLNSLLWLSIIRREGKNINSYDDIIREICNAARNKVEKIRKECVSRKIGGTSKDIVQAVSDVFAEKTVTVLCSGVYNTNHIPEDVFPSFSAFYETPNGIISNEKGNKKPQLLIDALLRKLSDFDKNGNLVYLAVANLAIKAFSENEEAAPDRRKLVESYFLIPNNVCTSTISRRICEMYSNAEVM